MKILLLAPQPFFQERGTPMAVRLLADAYARRGHEVDLVVFAEGADVPMAPGVRVLRTARLPGLSGVRPGFSLRKLVCGLLLSLKAVRLALTRRYDVYHGVEEAVYTALLLRRLRPARVVYDMDSSMREQMEAKSGFFRRLSPVLRWFEQRALRRPDVVLPVCDALADLARPLRRDGILLMRDPPVSAPATEAEGAAMRTALGLSGLQFVYVGNLESYQGIDLLLDAFRLLAPRCAEARLTIVGGAAADVQRYRGRVLEAGLEGRVALPGPRPVADLGRILAAADILVSPRLTGNNTPMKVYSYMQSGKPIVATAIATHTQVLDAGVAELAAPTPQAFAEAMARLAADPARRLRLGEAARRKCEAEYSLAAYDRAVDALCGLLATPAGSGQA